MGGQRGSSSMIGVPGGFDSHWCFPGQVKCMGKADSDCTFGERFTESEYIKTIFQWQNVGFIVLSILAFTVGKMVYRIPFLCLNKLKQPSEQPEGESETGGFVTRNSILLDKNGGVAFSFSGFLIGLAMILLASITDIDQGEKITKADF